jgi:hypothetical protein
MGASRSGLLSQKGQVRLLLRLGYFAGATTAAAAVRAAAATATTAATAAAGPGSEGGVRGGRAGWGGICETPVLLFHK